MGQGDHPLHPELYRPAQVERIAYHAGLRAHELLTLMPACERQASGHRQWSADRFTGREGARYTVEGKGGLAREVMLPNRLADALEARRLDEPLQVIDRGCT